MYGSRDNDMCPGDGQPKEGSPNQSAICHVTCLFDHASIVDLLSTLVRNVRHLHFFCKNQWLCRESACVPAATFVRWKEGPTLCGALQVTEMTSICAGDRDFDDFRSAPCPDGALRLGFFALNDFLLLFKP
jgi:hypothetical protein